MTAIMVSTLLVPYSVQASGSKSKPTSEGIDYIMKDGKKIGINKIELNPYTYINIEDTGGTVNLSTDKLREITKNKLMKKWSLVAEGFFRDQASQLVTIEGSGMMSSSKTAKQSFDRHFNYGRSDVSSGYHYDWSLSDFAATMSNASEEKKGSRNNDYFRGTPLTDIGSLHDARRLMGQELENCNSHGNVSTDEFLGNDRQQSDPKYRLPDLEKTDATKGFCKVLTCVNEAGASWDYDYNSFGIAFYDFDVSPIATTDMRYVMASQDYLDEDDPVKAAAEAGVPGVEWDESDGEPQNTYYKNKTSVVSTHSSALEDSQTDTVEDTKEEGFTYNQEESIGEEIGAGLVEQTLFKYTTTLNFTCGQAWSTSKSHTESRSVTKTKSISSGLDLPAHTVAKVVQNTHNTSVKESYQGPMVLNYKVAIFAMSGDYYNGAGAGGINPSMYDKQWLSTIFSNTADNTDSGCQAQGALYSRAVTNAGARGYDLAHGNYNMWCDKGAWSKSTNVDWKSINDNLQSDGRDSHNYKNKDGTKSSIKDIAKEIPFCERASATNFNRSNMTGTVDYIRPLYDLDNMKVTKGATHYELKGPEEHKPAPSLYLDQIELKGYDRDNIEEFDFDASRGSWVVCDADGNPRDPQDSDPATIETDEDGTQYVKAKQNVEETKDFYLTWRIDPDYQIITNDSPEGMTPEQIDNVKKPVIYVHVVKNSSIEHDGKINLSGGYDDLYSRKINMHSFIDHMVMTANGYEKNVPVYWEAKERKGITIDEDGDTSFEIPGTYHVRVWCSDNDGNPVYSDWMEIYARDVAELTTVTMEKPDLDPSQLRITKKKQTKVLDLEDYLKFYDQYGREWNPTLLQSYRDKYPYWPLMTFKNYSARKGWPDISFEVTDSDGDPVEGAVIDHNNKLRVSEPGTYMITPIVTNDGVTLSLGGEVTNESSKSFDVNPIKLTYTSDNWIDSVNFVEPSLSDEELTLHEVGDEIKIDNLEKLVRFYDQNDEEWTGDIPRISFDIIEDTSHAKLRGDTFIANAPGIYTIQALVAGYDVNPIKIEVLEDKQLRIVTSDINEYAMDEPTDVLSIDLNKYVDYQTQFGNPWKGDMPEVLFILDETVKPSEATVFGSNLSVYKPGDYSIHVKPRNPDEYSEPIDDIIAHIGANKRVEYFEFHFNMSKEEKTITHTTEGDVYPSINLNKCVTFYDQFDKPMTDDDFLPENDEFDGKKSSLPKKPKINFEVRYDSPPDNYDLFEDGEMIFKASGQYYITATDKEGVLKPKTADVTIFDSNEAIVQLDYNNGDPIKEVTVVKGEKLEKPFEPTYAGHVFIGWYLNDVKYSFKLPVEGDFTLIARWMTVEEYEQQQKEGTGIFGLEENTTEKVTTTVEETTKNTQTTNTVTKKTTKSAAKKSKTKSVAKVVVKKKSVKSTVIRRAIQKAKASNVTTIVLGKKVKKIAKKAFAKFKTVRIIVLKTKKLTAKSVKKALKGSRVKTIKIKVGSKKQKKKILKKYKKIFTKKIVGKKVKLTV